MPVPTVTISDDAAPVARRAEARLGDAGRVGVVQHGAVAPGRASDHGRGVRADPRLVDVRGGADGPAHDDRGQRAPDRAVAAELPDQRRRPSPTPRRASRAAGSRAGSGPSRCRC